jgi:ATP-dependent helicase HepA
VLLRWYNEGLNVFEANLPGGNSLLSEFQSQLMQCAMLNRERSPENLVIELEPLIRRTEDARLTWRSRLEQGRDRLVEMNSFHSETADRLIGLIRAEDQERQVETHLLEVFDQQGVPVEEIATRSYQINSLGVFSEAFPGLSTEGMLVTFDRQRALGRDTVHFLSRDHPLFRGAMDLVLTSEQGSSGFAHWPSEEQALLIETVYILEILVPKKYHGDRFLPPTPLRVVVNHSGADLSSQISLEVLRQKLIDGGPKQILEKAEFTERILPKMLEASRELADRQADARIQLARRDIDQSLGEEIQRSKRLAQTQGWVQTGELERAEAKLEGLMRALEHPQLRLDAVRVIWKGQV